MYGIYIMLYTYNIYVYKKYVYKKFESTIPCTNVN